jgi:gamma-glutamyltranspeptidase/glutathione hydrolase
MRRLAKRISGGMVTLGALVATIPPTEGQVDSAAAARLPVPGRSIVATKLGIVASSSPLASMAGVRVLERGGSAVDAAIAANATLGLVEPQMNGIGGDLFAIVYDAKHDKLTGLNSSGWAPTGLTPELLSSKGIAKMPHAGIYTVTVPGAVAGWDALRRKYGRLPFSSILAPAIYYAEHGFPVGEVSAKDWAESAEALKEEDAQRTYMPDGHPPRAGEVFRNADLARSLRRIAAKGRDGFYRGATSEAILALSRTHGGTMTAADLSTFTPEWVAPIQTTYHGWTVSELPPNSQGIAALMMLELMERFPLSEYGFHSARALHVMIEAKKLAYADMLRYVADPRFATVPVQAMLDKAHAAERAASIDPARAQCQVTPSQYANVSTTPGSETIYLTVIDRDGNIVSLIQSNFSGFGSKLVPHGAGFVLHNRGALFTLDAGAPNVLAPRKRPLHTIIPGFLQKDSVRIGFGIMGGWNQAQAHAQFVSNIVDYGMTIQQALEAGRFTKPTFDGCDVFVEALVPDSVRASLTAMGHQITTVAPRSGTFGYGQAVMSDGRGVHFGASEPRHDGAAIPEGAAVP